MLRPPDRPAGATVVTEDPVAIVDAAARRAWGALLVFYLHVALAARERRA